MSTAITTRPATKADAAEIALLVNIATHGGTAAGWRADEAAGETYDPVEIGRIEMLKDDSSDVRTAAQKALDEIANYLDAKAKWEARLK